MPVRAVAARSLMPRPARAWSTERDGAPICQIIGVVDGTIVGSREPVCTADLPRTSRRVSLTDASAQRWHRRDLVRSASMERSSSTPMKAGNSSCGGPVGSVESDGMPWDVLDLTTLSTSRIDVAAADGSPLFTTDVRSAAGWILFDPRWLGDFPWQRAVDRPVPILVNLVTDERIELVNLPHWTGNFSN